MTQSHRPPFFLRQVKLILIFPLVTASSSSTLALIVSWLCPSFGSQTYLKCCLLRDAFPHNQHIIKLTYASSFLSFIFFILISILVLLYLLITYFQPSNVSFLKIRVLPFLSNHFTSISKHTHTRYSTNIHWIHEYLIFLKCKAQLFELDQWEIIKNSKMAFSHLKAKIYLEDQGQHIIK